MRQLVTNLIVGNSLLTAAGFPMCGESDLKTCIAMLIMDRLDIGGSFAEFHPVDFQRDSVLVGHDGPHHINIAGGKPVIRSFKKYHGKPGSGASVEFRIREGPITMLSIGDNGKGSYKFVIAEGVRSSADSADREHKHARHLPAGREDVPEKWVAEAPTHHFALGIGHHGESLEKIGADVESGYCGHFEGARDPGMTCPGATHCGRAAPPLLAQDASQRAERTPVRTCTPGKTTFLAGSRLKSASSPSTIQASCH